MIDVPAASRSLRKTRRLALFVYVTQIVHLSTRVFPWMIDNHVMWLMASSAIGFFALSLLALVVLGLWTASVAKVARQLDARAPSVGTGAIVAGFVVPVLNFFRPYQIVRALDGAIDPGEVAVVPRASDVLPQGYRTAVPRETHLARPAPVKLWWAVFVVSAFALPVFGIVTNVFRLAEWPVATYAGMYRVLAVVGLTCLVARVALTVLVVQRMVARVSERLERLRDRDEALRG